ncbi:MAG: GntR family transcriptional regulator [Syntrophothermus sp.]
MHITIDRNSHTPVYLQIRNQIREMILTGALPARFRLPPERKLAETLGVNRSTVVNAYRELEADGLIASHVGRGTIVQPRVLPDGSFERRTVNPIPWRQFLSGQAVGMQKPLLRDLMELANREDVISFAAGIPAPELYPVEALQEIQNQLLKDHGRIALQHSPTEGQYPLRETISQFMKYRGISAPQKR